LLLRNVWLLLLVAILLTFLSGGRMRTRMDQVLVGAVAVDLLVLAPLSLMFVAVDGNLLMLRPDAQIAGAVDTVSRALDLPISMAVAGVVATRWRKASWPGRHALLPSVAGSVWLLFFTAVLTAGLVGVRLPQAVFWILAVSVLVVPVAFLAGLLRSRLARGALVELLRGMRATHSADLRYALARALGDSALVIAYPVVGGRTFVDAEDRPVTLPVDGGRSVAPIKRDGELVAALIYDRSLDDDPELVEAVGGAAAVALENQRLHSEAENRLAEVRASRERVIAAADAERRRIERNLHDGAQQRLVTLALQLSLIGRRIRDDPSDAERLLNSASGELAESLEELRELARGIHPAALDQGLDVGLEALARRSEVPTTVLFEPGPRLPEPVAFAAYFVASEALANVVKYAHASSATVSLLRTGTGAVIKITDDGVGGADPASGSGLRGLADRVEALDGSLRVSSPPGAGTVITADLPCRSTTAE
jgi:signal transduction histidine kinase